MWTVLVKRGGNDVKTFEGFFEEGVHEEMFFAIVIVPVKIDFDVFFSSAIHRDIIVAFESFECGHEVTEGLHNNTGRSDCWWHDMFLFKNNCVQEVTDACNFDKDSMPAKVHVSSRCTIHQWNAHQSVMVIGLDVKMYCTTMWGGRHATLNCHRRFVVRIICSKRLSHLLMEKRYQHQIGWN
jgi:hypothetical protein